MYTKEQLKDALIDFGIKKGDIILMHSSYKSLGEIDGGAMTIFEAFKEVLTEKGTLILPALSFSNVTREQPFFDKASTETCIGYLPEFFRTKVPDVSRSLHATHSCCAWGALADEFIKDHELDTTPVGPHSPFAKLPLYGGKILLLGSNTDSNTTLHGVEESVDQIPDYCIDFKREVIYTLTDIDKNITVKSYRHNFYDENGNRIRQCYGRIIDLLDDTEVISGKILDAHSHLMDAKAVWKKGAEKLKEDSHYFVEYQK